MDLWIRSQDNGLSKIVDILPVSGNKIIAYSINGRCMLLGEYKTNERASEVLYEIQDRIKPMLYLKPKASFKLNDIEAAKKYYEELNKIELKTCDNNFEIVPMLNDAIVYEMPEK